MTDSRLKRINCCFREQIPSIILQVIPFWEEIISTLSSCIGNFVLRVRIAATGDCARQPVVVQHSHCYQQGVWEAQERNVTINTELDRRPRVTNRGSLSALFICLADSLFQGHLET